MAVSKVANVIDERMSPPIRIEPELVSSRDGLRRSPQGIRQEAEPGVGAPDLLDRACPRGIVARCARIHPPSAPTGASRSMATRDDLETALADRWDDDNLAVYGDYLEAESDPRGALIAIDRAIDRALG